MTRHVTIVDYGMGNLWSVSSACQYLGATTEISHDADRVRKADYLVLPGVGSFRVAMKALRDSSLEPAILEAVKRGARMLGICLGMQLMASRGSEDGNTAGLGLFPGQIDRFQPDEVSGRKVPHIGFNAVRSTTHDGLFRGLPDGSDFYFVHAYRLLPDELAMANIATCRYGIDFVAAIEHENVCATQFHPEKSQTNGLALLKNFLSP